jgi:hypothetical protein
LRHGEELLDLKAGEEIERLRRGRPGLAGQRVFPRAFPRLGDDADGDRLRRLAGGRALPRGVTGDHLLAAVGGGEDDPAGEPSRAPFVGDDGDQLIVAGLEIFCEVDSDGVFPGFALGDLFAIEEERHSIVGRGGDDPLLGPAGKRLGEPVFTIVARAPDPVGEPFLHRGHLGSGAAGGLLLGKLLPAFGGNADAEPEAGEHEERDEEARGSGTEWHGRHSRRG